jgi:hypothetical protein
MSRCLPIISQGDDGGFFVFSPCLIFLFHPSCDIWHFFVLVVVFMCPWVPPCLFCFVWVTHSQFMKQPLVPLGCLTTAYFLMSGIKSFKNRDPRRAQKMMRLRVGAQFATLVAFVGYMGFDSFNLEAAPAYKRHKAVEQWEEEERAKQQQQQEQQPQQ